MNDKIDIIPERQYPELYHNLMWECTESNLPVEAIIGVLEILKFQLLNPIVGGDDEDRGDK